MRKLLTLVYTIVMLTAFCATAPAQVITADPNTPDAAAEQKVDDSTVDERLAQKVTYTATGKRLHTVFEELSAMTGVTVRCGKSDDDWRVRDLPIIVCCKDFPLGKLMKAIAESTHMLLSSYSVDGVKSYRIWWDLSRQKQLESFYKAKYEAALARANWEWDAWVKFGSMSDAEVEEQNSDVWQYESVRRDRLFAKIVAALGTEARKKVFAGDRVLVSAETYPNLTGLVSGMYRETREESEKREREFREDDSDFAGSADPDAVIVVPIDDDPEKAVLEIRLSRGDFPRLLPTLSGPVYGHTPAASGPELYVSDLPECPEDPEFPEDELSKHVISFDDVADNVRAKWEEAVEELWESLEDDYSEATEPYDVTEQVELVWPTPFNVKIKLKKPDEKKEIRFCDKVKALADSTGYAVVCEDFFSHKTDRWPDNSLFESEHEFAEVLETLSYKADFSDFFIDTSHKLIVGFPQTWYEYHAALVPEASLSDLITKLNREGLLLADVLSILRLTPEQYAHWIEDNPKLLTVTTLDVQREDKWFWLLYYSFTEQDKTQARSENGLALSKFDRAYMTDFYRKASEGGWDEPRLGHIFGNLRGEEMPDDPAAICDMVLYMKSHDVNYYGVDRTICGETVGSSKISGMPLKIAYSIELTSKDESSSEVYTLGCEFPLYSIEREKQLIEQHKASQSAGKPK